jgi:signal transduction histidine kinase
MAATEPPGKGAYSSMFSVRKTLLAYLVFATLWILLSDQAVAILVPSLEYVTSWQTIKGGIFVATSGTLLYFLMSRQFRTLTRTNKRLKRNTRRLELMRELDKALLSAESPHEIARTAVERIREMTPCYHVSMIVFETNSQMALVEVVSTVPTSSIQTEQRLSFVRGVDTLRKGEIFRVDDLGQIPDLTPSEQLIYTEGVRSYIHIPIQVHGQLIGSVNLLDTTAKRFSEEDIAIASEITTRVALALQQAQLLENTRDENVRLESLREAGLRLTESLSLEDVFHQVLNSALKLSERIDAIYIYIYQKGILKPRHQFWRDGTHPGNDTVYQPAENGIHYTVARSGDIVVVEDMAQNTQFRNNVLESSGAVIGLPLKIGPQVIGVMSVYSHQPRSFSGNEISLFSLLSDHVALAVHNALLYEQMQADIAQLESLRQVSLYLTSHLELQPVLEVILDYTLSLTESQNAHIFLYDGETLTFGAAVWESQKQQQPFKEIRSDGLTYKVARNGQMLVIPDIRSHALYHGIDEDGAIVGIPLIVHGKVRGVMNISRNMPHQFTDQELNLMQLISDQAAIAIHNAEMYEELQRKADEMERRVKERTAELQAANVRLTEYDRLRSKFVSDLSHELRTPVSSLNVRLYLMERSNPEQYPNHIASLKTQVDLLNDFIQNALDITRLDLEPTHATLGAVELPEVIEAVVATYREVAEANGVELLYAQEGTLPPLLGERNNLSQMVTHLVSNAVRYTKEGTIKVSTRIDEANDHILVTVEDTGIGIDEEDIPHIFERFYRGQQVAQLLPGTGLGLSIVLTIVKLHGGWLDVKSEVGKGSIFSIWLPTIKMLNSNGK